MANETIENAENVNIGEDRDPIIELIERAEVKPHLVEPTQAFGYRSQEPALLVLPDGPGSMKHVDLLDGAKARHAWQEQLAAHPLARRGTAVLTALASFVAWVLRFKKPETVIYASASALTAVVDYHGPEFVAVGENLVPGKPGHMRHRAVYAFPFSREWKFWNELASKERTQTELAELIESRIQDFVQPTGKEIEGVLLGVGLAGPSTMLALARGIEVKAKMVVKDAVTLASGEAKVSFDETHETAAKDGSAISVPGGFMISIPIYEQGARWRLAVRLRYRLANGRIAWLFALHQADAALQESYDEVLSEVELKTGVPVLRGTPEAG